MNRAGWANHPMEEDEMGLENHPNDDELWRRSPPKRDSLDRLYAELLNGSARQN